MKKDASGQNMTCSKCDFHSSNLQAVWNHKQKTGHIMNAVEMGRDDSVKPAVTVPDLVKRIAGWVATNSERESVFLSPEPAFGVNSQGLLDFVADQTGITKEQIGAWCNTGQLAVADEEASRQVRG